MKTSLTIAPQITNSGHNDRKQWRKQFLQIIADKKVFLSRLADYGCWIDRVLPMKNRFGLKDRIIVL